MFASWCLKNREKKHHHHYVTEIRRWLFSHNTRGRPHATTLGELQDKCFINEGSQANSVPIFPFTYLLWPLLGFFREIFVHHGSAHQVGQHIAKGSPQTRALAKKKKRHIMTATFVIFTHWLKNQRLLLAAREHTLNERILPSVPQI